jgi:hypothetical protein
MRAGRQRAVRQDGPDQGRALVDRQIDRRRAGQAECRLRRGGEDVAVLWVKQGATPAERRKGSIDNHGNRARCGVAGGVVAGDAVRVPPVGDTTPGGIGAGPQDRARGDVPDRPGPDDGGSTRAGTQKGGDDHWDAKRDGIGYSPFHDLESKVPAGLKAQLDTALAAMKAGSLKTCPDKCGDLTTLPK